jgi:predicted short-subunit dehydrogenase-like oxidoreductase (DUF2520 family)
MNHIAADFYATWFFDVVSGDPKDRSAVNGFRRNEARLLVARFDLARFDRRRFRHLDNIKQISFLGLQTISGLSVWSLGSVFASAMLPAMKERPRIAIVGLGNLGSALALSLRRAGYAIEVLLSRGKSAGKVRTLAKKIGVQIPDSPLELKADIVWFCVPDSQIARAARSLAKISWKGRVALHSSGALTSDELAVLRREGAAVASAHPLMTFVHESHPPLAGVPFAIEGDARAARIARSLVRTLGGKSYPVRKKDKAAYHAWATFASPLLTALLVTSEQVARLAGVQAKAAKQRMIPILLQTLVNYATYDAASAFSGPVIRGDVETIRKHLRILRKTPVAREVYKALAHAALEYLPARNAKSLKQALDSKRG